METNGNGLGLDRLSRSFGSTKAISEVSLHADPGEFLVLLGPSGCGKTTLLRVIAGLLEPDGGRVLLEGRDITDLAASRRDLAMVFQSYALYPHLSVGRNIGFPLRMRRLPKAEIKQRVEDVSELLELGELLDRKPRELSGGQRQRVALGRAIVRRPSAFLMDEPLSNLDAMLRTQTRAELIEIHRALGTTFVYVTHDQVEAMTMATRVALLNRGVVEQVGTPMELYDRPASAFVAAFLGSPPMNLLEAEASGSGDGLRVRAAGVDVALDPAGEVRREVVLGVRPEDLTPTADPGPTTIEAEVKIVETLGSEEVAHCEVGSARVAVRGRRPLGLEPGQRVLLTAPADRFHLFDRAAGRRLVRRTELEADRDLDRPTALAAPIAAT